MTPTPLARPALPPPATLTRLAAPPPRTPVLPIGPVKRCCCTNLTFRDLKSLADATGAGLDELSATTGCGSVCGSCVPYLRVMLKTGCTELPVLSDDDVRRILADDAPAR